MAEIGGNDADLLKSFIGRIQSLEGEEREISEQKAEVYDEASAHFDKRALKTVVRRLRKSRAEIDADDFFVEQYEHALGIGDRGEPPRVIRVEDLPDASRLPARSTKHAIVEPHAEARWAGHEDGLMGERENEDGQSERIDAAAREPTPRRRRKASVPEGAQA